MRGISIHLSYWTRNWSDDLAAPVERAAACGFSGIDIPLLNPGEFQLQKMKEALKRYNLCATCGTGLGPATDVTSPEKKIRRQGIEHLKRCLELAASLDAPILGGVTYVPWGQLRSAEEPQLLRERSIESIREAAATASDFGVTLCVEVLNRYESWMLNTVEQGLSYLQDAGSPSLALHLDTFHMNIEEDCILNSIELAGDKLGHLHCSENNRKMPGKGHIPWDLVGKTLRKIEYSGVAAIECFVDPDSQVGNDVNIWRPLFLDLDRDARAGAEFLKALWEVK